MSTIQCTVVFFNNGKINKYVAEMPSTGTGKRIPIYTDDIQHAHLYDDEKAARAYISTFHDLHGRTFETMQVTVDFSQDKKGMPKEEVIK